MEINKGKIFLVVIVSIVLVIMFIIMNFTVSNVTVRGIKKISYVKETDVEFSLEKEALLRNKPSFSSKIIGTIKKDTNVQVLQKLNKWIQITDGSNTGWVIMQNVVTLEIKDTQDAPENNTVNNQYNTINEIVENKVSNEAINNVSNKIENNTNSVENKVLNTVNNTSNTVSNATSNKVSNTTSNSNSNVGKKGVVNVETAKVREKPDGKMVGLVDIDDKVEILAEEGDWYKVNIDEYKGCYIAKRLVTIKK